jgi:hypothetical protein
MKATGRCLCGAVTFTADGVESGFHVCHCSMCRHWSGGPLLSIGVASVKFDDETHLKRFASSAWAERGFCGQCGSSLFYRLKSADQYVINLGVFDDQSKFEIAGEIYVEDKPPGYDFAGDHPRMTGEEFLASLQK